MLPPPSNPTFGDILASCKNTFHKISNNSALREIFIYGYVKEKGKKCTTNISGRGQISSPLYLYFSTNSKFKSCVIYPSFFNRMCNLSLSVDCVN
jgi:hypothetical protein